MSENSDNKNLPESSRGPKLNPVPLKFGGIKPKAEESPPTRAGLPTAEEARSEYEKVENPRKIIRQGMLVIFFFFGILGVWAFFGHIQGAVVGSGRIKIDNERKIVQHLEGGIVDLVLVRDGQEVVAGEPLIVLQSVQTDANTKMLQKELVAMLAQKERAEAEKSFSRTLDWPAEIKKLAAEAQSEDVLENEARIFETRRQVLDTQLSMLDAQMAQLKAQISGSQEQINAESRIIAAIEEELGAKRKLHKERFVDKTQILSLERDLANHQGQRGRLRQAIAETREREAELKLRSAEVKSRYIDDATQSSGDLETRLIQQRERLRPSMDASARLQIKAPVGGRVVDLKVHTQGAVVMPGEVLMDIVPHDHPLTVETQVPTNRITEVYLGQPALIQLDAFDTRMVPPMPGKVTYISADALQPAGGYGEPYYLCNVEVDPEALKKERLYMSPGMPATVYITTTERTIVYYMFEPYIKSWQRALRD